MRATTDRNRLCQFQVIAPIAIILNTILIVHQHLTPADAAQWNNDTTDFDSIGSQYLDAVGVKRFRSLDEWTALDFVFLGCLLMLGLELNSLIIKVAGGLIQRSTIPVRGCHLDDFSPTDILYIRINKAATPPFVYFLVRYMFYAQNTEWDFSKISIMNTLFPIPVIVIIFDFFYMLLHWLLHMKFIYPYIHMHHHRQKAPSRATDDAVNVHPIEFFLGEYNHLFAVFIFTHILGREMHILSILILLILSGLLAALNHTRHDVVFEIYGVTIFDSKFHDVHHRLPRQNYAQFIPLWDKLFGTWLDYNADDRINLRIQLDPMTGKTLSAERAKLISCKFS